MNYLKKNCSKLLIILMIATMPIFLVSCATIVRNKAQTVSILPNVDDVDIVVKNKKGINVFKGKAPIVLPLSAANTGYFNGEKYTIFATKKGYKSTEIKLNSKVSAWYVLGNFFFGGLIGWLIIDPITGDMFYLDEEVKIALEPENN